MAHKDPEAAKAYNKAWSQNNREKKRVAVRKWQQKRRETLGPAAMSEIYRTNNANMAGWRKDRRDYLRKYHREYQIKHRDKLYALRAVFRAKVKAEVLAHYGGHCRCCGEATPAFLTLDHINNDGGQQRKQSKKPGGVNFYRWIQRHGYPNDLQVLCFNCNMAKRDDGTCPHSDQARSLLRAV